MFLALDEHESAAVSSSPMASTVAPATRTHMQMKKARIRDLHNEALGPDLVELIKDFLEHYQLEYTQALLNTEAEAVSQPSHRCLPHSDAKCTFGCPWGAADAACTNQVSAHSTSHCPLFGLCCLFACLVSCRVVSNRIENCSPTNTA